MSSRVHTHPSLPAPSPHTGYSTSQSKSHVLAGVQDAYWSDEEAEDAECPLCLEEMDISDLNFKPCVCGYQICRFCWHHIKENLNGRCPACRREYSEESVQFKPVNKEDHKRLTQQKKQRERERKDLDALNRRHLANVRVVQRNVVYVVGIGPRFAKEELIPTLRSNEYFGQYGKISKILLVKRTPPGGRAPVVGLYITFHRREDAARCIAVVDGAPSPGGGTDVMRASYGTTKYCMAFLRGATCNDHSCMRLHEWGDEKDCFTKEDLTTLKHTMKDNESRARNGSTTAKKADESEGPLPRAASWANKTSATPVLPAPATAPSQSRQTRRGAGSSRQQRSSNTPASSGGRSSQQDRKASASASGKVATPAPSSRPSTPALASFAQRSAVVAEAKAIRSKVETPPPQRVASPTLSTAVESEKSYASKDAPSAEPASRPQSVEIAPSPALESAQAVPTAPPGLSAVPPGLSAPPGLPPPKSRPDTASPQISLLSSYQMSTQARALLEDFKSRRDHSVPVAGPAPFPDFDRMLATLSGADGQFGGFSFNLDPKLAAKDQGETFDLADLPEFRPEAEVPFNGNFLNAFPGLRTGNHAPHMHAASPPGLAAFMPASTRPIYDPAVNHLSGDGQQSGGSTYRGSFDPFAESVDDSSRSRASGSSSALDDDSSRKVSRFGFARGRQGSALSSTSSPLHGSSPLEALPGTSFYSSDPLSPPQQAQHASPWLLQRPEYTLRQNGSATSSPLAPQAQVAYIPPSTRFQPFDQGLSEAQLRDFIHSSRGRMTPAQANSMADPQPTGSPFKFSNHAQFADPAIMSAAFNSPVLNPHGVDNGYNGHAAQNFHAPIASFGPPPGLSFRPGTAPSPAMSGVHGSGPSTNIDMSQVSSAQVSASASPAPLSPSILSPADFPVLTSMGQPAKEQVSAAISEPVTEVTQDSVKGREKEKDAKAQAKADKKLAKQAAAAERAAERARIAQEKAALRVAEKAKLAVEKAAEKERMAKEKAEKERLEKERLEKEKTERLEKVRAEKERSEKEQLAKEKAAHDQKVAEAEAADKQAAKQASGASAPQAKVNRPASRSTASASSATAVHAIQAPLMSKMPRKSKPTAKPIKIPRDEDGIPESGSTVPSATATDAPMLPTPSKTSTADTFSNHSRAQSVERSPPAFGNAITDMLEQIHNQQPWMKLAEHPFFDPSKINPAAKMPLEYGPLVHALSALSVGGGSFANNMPSGSIDNAVSSFQQLLETLTQTISDLLRLLPRTTWDDSSSFDGVLRDMLKGDDFLDDGGEDGNGREDEVAALTLALERRARWMEVQLSKLEELHRDINTAAVRAVLSFNDRGWDKQAFLPRVGNTLARFDTLGFLSAAGAMRAMTADELEKKLTVAKEAAVFAETELREAMTIMPIEFEY